MTIQYALTRTEACQGYFRSLRNSRRYLGTILLYAVGLSGLVLVERGVTTRAFTFNDVAIGLLAGVAFMLFLPIMLFIRAKTSKRWLTLSPDGISTQIGTIRGGVSWKQIKVISETDRYVLISRASGNAFFVPSRAFSNSEQRAEFVTRAKRWANIA